jgi:nucleotide-binding universal stress UspA family protein
MLKRIIFAVDIEEKELKSAFMAAATMAESHGAELVVMNVIPDYGVRMVQKYFPKNWLNDMIKDAETKLASLIKKHVPDTVTVKQIVGRGSIYESIIETANQLSADLIMVSAHSNRHKDYLLGPNAAKIVRHAQVSVLVMRG